MGLYDYLTKDGKVWTVRPGIKGELTIQCWRGCWHVWEDGSLTEVVWMSRRVERSTFHSVGSELHQTLAFRAAVVKDKEAAIAMREKVVAELRQEAVVAFSEAFDGMMRRWRAKA